MYLVTELRKLATSDSVRHIVLNRVRRRNRGKSLSSKVAFVMPFRSRTFSVFAPLRHENPLVSRFRRVTPLFHAFSRVCHASLHQDHLKSLEEGCYRRDQFPMSKRSSLWQVGRAELGRVRLQVRIPRINLGIRSLCPS